MELFIYIAAIFGVCLIAKLFAAPIKFILKLFANAILGGLALIIINFIGQHFGFHIDLNFVTAFIVGVLGLPGIAVLFILQML